MHSVFYVGYSLLKSIIITAVNLCQCNRRNHVERVPRALTANECKFKFTPIRVIVYTPVQRKYIYIISVIVLNLSSPCCQHWCCKTPWNACRTLHSTTPLAWIWLRPLVYVLLLVIPCRHLVSVRETHMCTENGLNKMRWKINKLIILLSLTSSHKEMKIPSDPTFELKLAELFR